MIGIRRKTGEAHLGDGQSALVELRGIGQQPVDGDGLGTGRVGSIDGRVAEELDAGGLERGEEGEGRGCRGLSGEGGLVDLKVGGRWDGKVESGSCHVAHL